MTDATDFEQILGDETLTPWQRHMLEQTYASLPKPYTLPDTWLDETASWAAAGPLTVHKISYLRRDRRRTVTTSAG